MTCKLDTKYGASFCAKFTEIFSFASILPRILGLSLISGFASGAIAMLPSISISGITTGRNSFGAISASITKRYVNATIRNMALKTMGKMFTYNLVTSAFDVAWGGFTDATGFDDSVYDFWQSAYGWLHI